MTDLFEACNELFSDPQLYELLEVNKNGGNLLDILSPRENQHSDILAWCFNSREGHDQGDAVLKDFLIEIYKKSTGVSPGDLLAGNGYTKDFVRYWTPGRIAVSSFGSAIFLREYSILGDGKGTGRIDLLIIDPDNKFIVVVENKAGAKLTEDQLARYVEGIKQQLLSKSIFKEYLRAFVALDRDCDLEPDDEGNVELAPDKRWALLNYDWLSDTAKRVEHAVKRGNQAAVLLRAYCLRQSTQIEYSDDQERKLFLSLAERHSIALKELKEIRNTSSKPEEWTKYREDSPREYLLRMYMQNSALWDRLIGLSPIELLDAKIQDELDYLEDDNVGLWRKYAAYRTKGTDLILGNDGEWPIFIQVKHVNEKSGAEARFRVGIKFRPQHLSEDKRVVVTEILSRSYPGLAKSRIQERGKWIDSIEGLDSDAAKNKVLEMEQALQVALKMRNEKTN